MNRIFENIRAIIDENRALYLPYVQETDLEKDGAIFYMNAQNGTEFDWFVNERLPFFMVFYNDGENLGAVKLALYNTGEVQVFLYAEKGKKLVKKVKAQLDVSKTELLKLAAVLTAQADDKKLWDGDIEDIPANVEITEEELRNFSAREKNHAVMKNRMNICNLFAVVSKQVAEEGWKVGYMERTDPHDENDSGWFFASGKEEEQYLSDPKNLMLLAVGMVWQRLDRDIIKYIDMPIGTKLIRVSSNAFEIDKNEKEIYTEKRE